MLSFTEKVLFSSQVKVENEVMQLSIVQNMNKEICIFLVNGKKDIFKIIEKSTISKITKEETCFSWTVAGLRVESDLNLLDLLLKADFHFESQDLFYNPFEWTRQYILSESLPATIEEHCQIDHVKYTIQKILQNNQIATYDSAKVWVGTWNVNSQTCFPASLDSWILNEDYDVFVFGFQELDTSTEAYIVQDSKREGEWSILIEKSLKSHSKIASKQLVGMLILVYVKTSHEKYVSQVRVASLGTGLLGMMGNKGAVAVRFMFKDSHFCFVNSHLAADSTMVDKRNQDFKDICNKLEFSLHTLKDFEEYCLHFPWIPVDWSNIGLDSLGKTHLSIFDVEYVLVSFYNNSHLIWLGDLNYRVSVSEEYAKEAVRSSQFENLLVSDQLSQEIKAQRAFQTFKEGKITFPPTYKFEAGTNNYYNGYSSGLIKFSEKQRTPSWCDRILWHQNPQHLQDESWLSLLWYESALNLMMSDHKPVMALFDLKTRSVDYEKFQKTVDDVSRELDMLENASLPTIKISQQQLSFGGVRYKSPQSCSFLIENTGTVFFVMHLLYRLLLNLYSHQNMDLRDQCTRGAILASKLEW